MDTPYTLAPLALRSDWCSGGTGDCTYVPMLTTYRLASNRPLKLTLSDVAYLRQAAQRDPQLRAVLEKFTDQIEIDVP